MSNLHTVTITGADDLVDPRRLVDLSAEFPFVEWGILRSAAREGKPRYPSPRWRDTLAIVFDRAGVALMAAAHLCGSISRSAMGGGERWRWTCAIPYRRIQLNGWSSYRLPELRIADHFPDVEFIAQAIGASSFEESCAFVSEYKNMSVLYDPSGGSGLLIEGFPIAEPPVRIGYAGGISPLNVVSVLERIPISSRPTWIDMESGVRTDDRFDLDKVRAVLESCRPYVGTQQ